MKTVPASKGPFPTRPYYTDDDIEQLCSNALAETNLLLSKPGRTRIDRLIDKKFRVPIIFESLDKGVLGFTEFGPKGVEAIHIADPPGELFVEEDRRTNSTIAHEAGHCLMHAHLFIEYFANNNLFEDDPDVTQRRILCRVGRPNVRTKQQTYDGRWWEFQANRAIGALLMPKQLFLTFMQPYLERSGTLMVSRLPNNVKEEAIKMAAHVFDVNPAVARVRMNSNPF
jgi:hypothetical protein